MWARAGIGIRIGDRCLTFLSPIDDQGLIAIVAGRLIGKILGQSPAGNLIPAFSRIDDVRPVLTGSGPVIAVVVDGQVYAVDVPGCDIVP
jgi:hypothetical protein